MNHPNPTCPECGGALELITTHDLAGLFDDDAGDAIEVDVLPCILCTTTADPKPAEGQERAA